MRVLLARWRDPSRDMAGRYRYIRPYCVVDVVLGVVGGSIYHELKGHPALKCDVSLVLLWVRHRARNLGG